MAALALAWTVGGFGAHRFYLQQPGLGILYAVFIWTFIPVIIALLDGLTYLSMTDEQFLTRFGVGPERRNLRTPPRILPPGWTLAHALRWIGGMFLLTLAFAVLAEDAWPAFLVIGIMAACLIPPTGNFIFGRLSAQARRRLGYWLQTALGGLAVLSFVVNTVTDPSRGLSMLPLVPLGFCLVPFGWDWIAARSSSAPQTVQKARWATLVLSLVALSILSP